MNTYIQTTVVFKYKYKYPANFKHLQSSLSFLENEIKSTGEPGLWELSSHRSPLFVSHFLPILTSDQILGCLQNLYIGICDLKSVIM